MFISKPKNTKVYYSFKEAIEDQMAEYKNLNPKDSKKGKQNVLCPALHPEFYDPLISVAELSIEKGYEPLNWLDEDSPVTMSYCLAAAERHLKKAKMGYDLNTEEITLDGLPCKTEVLHLAQVAYNCLMACKLLKEKGDKIDDRIFKNGKKKKVSK